MSRKKAGHVAPWQVFIPNYPFYKIISEGNLGGFAGVVVFLLTVVRLAENFIALFNFKASLAARARKEVVGLIWATAMYYFFWWFSPKFIIDIGLYFSLYVFYPAMFVFSIMAIGVALFALLLLVGAASKKD